MPCTPEQLAANRKNAALSTGPRTEEGKAASRANGYKHGLTGAGVVQSSIDAAATDELSARLHAELKPRTVVGKLLVDRMAVLSARLQRSARQELDYLHGRTSETDLPAFFDGSPEAILMWKYEAAAERGLYRALKELREVEGETPRRGATSEYEIASKGLASSLKALQQEMSRPQPSPARSVVQPVPNPKVEPSILDMLDRGPSLPPLPSSCVNFSIGKRR